MQAGIDTSWPHRLLARLPKLRVLDLARNEPLTNPPPQVSSRHASGRQSQGWREVLRYRAMRAWLVLLIVIMTSMAAADPPGDPPSLAKVTGSVVSVVDGKDVQPLDVFLTGAETWTVSASQGEAVTLTIELAKLAVGTFQGKDAALVIGKRTLRGNWIIEITKASPGYLKSPGLCTGRLAATFGKTTYVTGGFVDAGCLSYRQKP